MVPMKTAVVVLIAALLLEPLFACSPDLTPALHFTKHPDDPIAAYVGGELGILHPSYARAYLVVAYRWMTDPPDAAARQGMGELLDRRLRHDDDGVAVLTRWQQARARFGPPPRVDPYRPGNDYGWFVNCGDDAFRTAANTLEARIAAFGAGHRGVRSWVSAQDMVFANCDGANATPLPAQLDLPPVFHYDRAYQLAAADFYAMRYERARARFLAIARDRNSQWRHIARYVAVRTLIRQTNIAALAIPFDAPAPDPRIGPVVAELEAILADPDMQSLHEDAERLLRYVHYRGNPQARLASSARVLASNGRYSAGRFREELEHYTWLLNRGDPEPRDAMTDWIRTFQDPDQRAYAVRRWRTTKSLPWLVAALAHAQPDDAAVPALLAARVDRDSPAFLTISYHRARLLTALGRYGEARAEVDRAIRRKGLTLSTRQLLGDLRRALARSLGEFVRDVAQMPVGDAHTEREFVPLVDATAVLPRQAAMVFNRALPLDQLVLAARDESLPASVRHPLLVAVFTRAALLRRDALARRLSHEVAKLDPELADALQRWRAAPPARRRFETLDLIVHFPALTPYVEPLGSRLAGAWPLSKVFHGHGENWWCDGDSETEVRMAAYQPMPYVVPLFAQSPAIRERAERERRQLRAFGARSHYIVRGAIAWARAHPNDPGVPEALSVAIKGARWACGESTKDASLAFLILHTRYKNTKWAQETRYFY
jgi:tetratricopeptide (TPR) repeat protein